MSTKVKNIAAILGFILLLIIGIWSAIQVITFVPRLFSDTGTTPTTINNNGIDLDGRSIAVELDTETVNSGDTVTANFAHSGDETGVLSFSYACEEGFYFQIADRPVPCNAPYTIPTTSTSLDMIPLSANETTEVAFAITYTNTDGESVRDTKKLTVLNAQATEEDTAEETNSTEDVEVTVETETPATEGDGPREPSTVSSVPVSNYFYTPQTQASNPYGTVDLQVQVLSIGDINAYGAFEAKGVVHPYNRAGATFRVTNLGTKQSGLWYFSSTLPTQGGYSFDSGAQPSLMPGESVDIFITFDQLIPGTFPFSVHVDPFNYLRESNEYNNTASKIMTVLLY